MTCKHCFAVGVPELLVCLNNHCILDGIRCTEKKCQNWKEDEE